MVDVADWTPRNSPFLFSSSDIPFSDKWCLMLSIHIRVGFHCFLFSDASIAITLLLTHSSNRLITCLNISQLSAMSRIFLPIYLPYFFLSVFCPALWLHTIISISSFSPHPTSSLALSSLPVYRIIYSI